MEGLTKIALGLAVIFIATFMLFYIFDNINKMAEKCKTEEPKTILCSQLSSFTVSMLVILLIIGGFLFVILVITYLLLSS
jgi:predicted PurR-regulated permease PerM